MKLEVSEGTQDYKRAVFDWSKTFAGLHHVYPHVRNVQLRLKQALEKVCPPLAGLLEPPPSRPAIDESLAGWRSDWDRPDITMPDDLMCWNLLTSFDNDGKIALFGEMHDTHMGISCSPAPIDYYFFSFRHESILVAGPFYRSCWADTALVKRGNIWVETQDGTIFIVAENWIDFVENYVLGLELGNLLRLKNGISKWPQLSAVEAITRDLKIRVSFLQHPCSEYLFMYHITLSMDENATQNKSKLKTRHWRIADEDGGTDNVDGPGVVGRYPEIGPGSSFSYSSCCPLPTPTGTMQGIFKFEDMVTGEIWDCIVPRMDFVALKTITPQTIANKDLQPS